MIRSVVRDMIDFLVILFLSIIMFTILNGKISSVVENKKDQIHVDDEHLDMDDHTFNKDFRASYNIAILGDFEHIQLVDFFTYSLFMVTCIF